MKTDGRKRAVLYARKSLKQDRTEEQSASVEDQLRRCRAYADDRGWQVVAEEHDDGRSGLLDSAKRPGLKAALTVIESGDADVIVTLWTSRLSRKDDQRARIVSMFDRLGVEWHAVDDGGKVDRKSFAGYLRYGVTTLFDDAYSIRVGENWRAAHQKRLDAGLPKTTSPRFGYRYVFDEQPNGRRDNGRYVVQPSEAEVVKELYRRYTRGDGFTQLVRWLDGNDWRTSTGKAWSVRTLNRFMDSGFAAGFISREEEHRNLRGSHEVIITDTEWLAYRAERERRAELGRTKQPGSNTRWWLAGLVRCGVCGGSTFIDSFTRDRSSVMCSTKRGNKSACKSRAILRTYVENAVGLWLGGHLDLLDQLAQVESNEVENASATAYTDAVAEQEKVEVLLTDLELAQIDPDRARDDAVFRRMRDALTKQLNDARRAARDAAVAMEQAKREEVDTATVREGMEQGWNDDHRAALRQVLDRVEVHPDHITIIPVTGEPTKRTRKELAPACNVGGCDRKATARGLCQSHSMRARNLGIFEELAERVAESVEAPGPTITVEDVEELFASVAV